MSAVQPNPAAREWYPATVAGARMLTHNARELTLSVPGIASGLPGQHVDVRLTAVDGYQAVRSYSLAATGVAERVDLVVASVPDGEVSAYLVEVARPGDQMEIRGPVGGYFVWHQERSAPVLLVAGGSGVVPLLSMVRARTHAADAPPFRLVYSVREPEEAIARGELDHTDGVETHWVHTREAPPDSTRPVGRLTPDDLVADGFRPQDDIDVFVCGPTGFVEAAAAMLADLGHPVQRIRTERFGGS